MKIFEITEAVVDRNGNPVRDGSGKPVRSASDPDTMQKLQSIQQNIQTSNQTGDMDAATQAGLDFLEIVNDEVMPDLVKTLDQYMTSMIALVKKYPDHPEVQKYKQEVVQAMNDWQATKSKMQKGPQNANQLRQMRKQSESITVEATGEDMLAKVDML